MNTPANTLPRFFSVQRDNRVITCGNTAGFNGKEYFERLAAMYPGAALRWHDENPQETRREVGPLFGMTWEQVQKMQQGE